jgi:hypothetical protein
LLIEEGVASFTKKIDSDVPVVLQRATPAFG